MIGSIGKRGRGQDVADIILAFIQSWNMHGRDETSICSGAVDVLRAYLGDRPCCVWKNVSPGLTKICERGMMDLYFNQDKEARESALAKTLVTGSAEFDPCKIGSFMPELKMSFGGFLNVPIKVHEEIIGIYSIAVFTKESRDRIFVQTLECLGRLIAIALKHGHDHDANDVKAKQLRAELEATMRELTQTNTRLIDRVRELKTMSKELEKRVEELTHANRAKDEFLSIVSHELRTPLTSLNGFLCVLFDGEAGPLTDSQKKFLSIAKQSATRLNVLISDLLDISRIESGRLNLDMTHCLLFEIIQKSVVEIKSSAEAKEIKIQFQAMPFSSDVWGDANRLQQVVDNLLSNAIKFTPHGGLIEVISEDKGDGIQVSVKDNGPGIEETEKKKIFDMFYQVDASSRRSAGGAGLGLAIANGIISMHGGRIWVDSEKGKGTTFTFIVPRYKMGKVA